MTIKPINSILLICVLFLSQSVMAQDSDSDINAKLASVNAQIESTTQENEALKAQLAEIQDQIDALKQESEEKEDKINSLKEEAGDSED